MDDIRMFQGNYIWWNGEGIYTLDLVKVASIFEPCWSRVNELSKLEMRMKHHETVQPAYIQFEDTTPVE